MPFIRKMAKMTAIAPSTTKLRTIALRAIDFTPRLLQVCFRALPKVKIRSGAKAEVNRMKTDENATITSNITVG